MDKAALRRALVEERLNLPDRLQRADALQRVMRLWLLNQSDTVIGAYWPIKGEFDPCPPCTAGRKTASCSTSPSAAASACP